MADPKWIEISLTVSSEQAEAVAEVLNRAIPNGVVVEQNAVQENSSSADHLEKRARVFGYLLADEEIHEKKRGIIKFLRHLSQIQPLPEPVFTPIWDEDWMAAWKNHYQPIEVGNKLVILPAWLKREHPGRLPIRINPGMAFGTGAHPSTQLCLVLLEQTVAPGMKVIDVGCGSGILTIAALRLGAGQCLGVDVDPAARQSTMENIRKNHICSGWEAGIGSVKEILNGQFAISSAPLVVVNILANTILQLFSEGLVHLVEPEGKLILSGILETQADNVLQSAENKGLSLDKKISSSDWVALQLIKTG